MQFSSLIAATFFVATGLASPVQQQTDSVNAKYEKLSLPDPQNWVSANKRLNKDAIIVAFQGQPGDYDQAAWDKYMQEQCSAQSKCKSTTYFMNGDVWFGFTLRVGPVEASDFKRDNRAKSSVIYNKTE